MSRESGTCKACGVEGLNTTGKVITGIIVVLIVLLFVLLASFRDDISPFVTVAIIGLTMGLLIICVLLLVWRGRKGRY